jgi:hypothetical protein
MEIKMTIKEYNSVKETLERLLPEDSKLRSRILSEFYEAKRKTNPRQRIGQGASWAPNP